MPPKPKYTRRQVAAAAYEIVKQSGLGALTARELGRRLGTSASPIFTVFDNMDQVRMAARELAMAEFQSYLGDYRSYTPAFKRIGMKMVAYGLHCPEQFKLLFMQPHDDPSAASASLADMGQLADECIGLIRRDYGLPKQEARLLLEQMWTQAFGLGAMCAMKVCRFSEEEISRRLSTVFVGTMMLIKSGKLPEISLPVEKDADGVQRAVPLWASPEPKASTVNENQI